MCESFVEHTCGWCVANAKVAFKANRLKASLHQSTELLHEASNMHTMSPTATLAVGLKHVGVKIDEQTRSLEHLGNNINSGTHHHRPYSRAELARGMLDKATCGQGPSVQQTN